MSASSHATETDGKQDSYLKRYYRTLPEEKRLMIEQSLMNAENGRAHVSVGAPLDPDKKEIQKNEDEDAEGDNPKEPSSKKSSTCIVL